MCLQKDYWGNCNLFVLYIDDMLHNNINEIPTLHSIKN